MSSQNAAREVRRSTMIELLEPRRLLSGDPLLEEVLVPGEFDVGAAPDAQSDPYIAEGPGGTSLALWTDYRTGGMPNFYFGMGNGTLGDIWAARIAADGTLIDEVPITVTHDDWNQVGAKAAWNGTSWLVVWASEQNPYSVHLHAARLSPDGTLLDETPILIMDDSFQDQYGNPVDPLGPLDVQPRGDGWVVTWQRSEPNPDSPYGVDKVFYATNVAPDGTVLNPAGARLLSGAHNDISWLGLTYSPSNGGQFLQAFSIQNYTADFQPYDTLYVMRRNLDLSPIDTQFRTKNIGDINAFHADIVGSGAGWMLAFRDAGGAGALRVASAGTFADASPVRIHDGGNDTKVDAAFDGSEYVVAYADYFFAPEGLAHRVLARRLGATGAADPPVVLRTLDNPAYDVNATGRGGGAYSVLLADSSGGMTDIAVLNVSGDDSVVGPVDVSNAARSHTAPAIASDGTNFLTVFTSFNADVGDIKGVRMNNSGQALEAEPFTIVPDALNPAGYEVVFFGGRYVVMFIGDGPSGRMIYGQQVGTDGSLIGSPVPMTANMGLGGASVLGDRLLVTGTTQEFGHHSSVRFVRIFDASLAPVTDRINVNYGFSLAGDVGTVGGRWLLSWAWKSTHDAPRAGIAYAFVGPDGATAGGQSLVSTYPTNGTPTVVSMGEDAAEAMLIWNRVDTPPEISDTKLFPRSGEGLVGQRMAADGTRIGGLTTLVDEAGVSTAPDAVFDGSNYVVTWVDGREHPYPDQEHADVYAARVAIDGTVLDPGGFPVANTERPEDNPTIGSGGGHTFFAYRSFRYEKPYASYRIATRLLDDLTNPENGPSEFNVNDRQGMGFEFEERLYSVTTSDLVVTNITTGATFNPAHFAVEEKVGAAGAWEYGFHYTGAGGASLLPNGNYVARLPAGSVLDKAGNPLDHDVVMEFYVLAGDANRDRWVDGADLAILKANYGKRPRVFTQADFNYDGVVNLADWNILRANNGTYLPPPSNDITLFGGPDSDSDDGPASLL